VSDKSAREDEAKAALKRLEAEREKLLGAPEDYHNEPDRIEILGKRIGRTVSYALALFLLYYLWTLI
jgi:hypothetical protein